MHSKNSSGRSTTKLNATDTTHSTHPCPLHFFAEHCRQCGIEFQKAPSEAAPRKLNTMDLLHSTHLRQSIQKKASQSQTHFTLLCSLQPKCPNRQRLQQRDRKASQKDLTKPAKCRPGGFSNKLRFWEWLVLHLHRYCSPPVASLPQVCQNRCGSHCLTSAATYKTYEEKLKRYHLEARCSKGNGFWLLTSFKLRRQTPDSITQCWFTSRVEAT